VDTREKNRVTSEFDTNISVDGVNYLVRTEDLGEKKAKIMTSVLLDGKSLVSSEVRYLHLLGSRTFARKLTELMKEQQKATIEKFVREREKKMRKKSEYFKEANAMLQAGREVDALTTMQEGVNAYPGDPFLLSYYGCLVAVVDRRPTDGVKLCKQALARLRHSLPFGNDMFYPVFYLNLGRAYLVADNRKDAIQSLKRGLSIDPKNRDLLDELKKLGVRKKPTVAFLERSHPINRWIGILLNRRAATA
jgi:tetratricopeptide (TPR) repeat protein